jgi:hypothetical protein
MVSSSMMVRGIMTALAWFNPKVQLRVDLGKVGHRSRLGLR